MKKTFSFGKVDYNNTGRKTNLVTVEVELREDKQGRPVFSACGNVWNNNQTDTLAGGQIIDEISEMLPNNNEVAELHRLWKAHHLNDLNAGTSAQTLAIKAWKEAGNKYDYTAACEHLKSIGLYDDNGYKYGHGWIYRPIPNKDLQIIRNLLQ